MGIMEVADLQQQGRGKRFGVTQCARSALLAMAELAVGKI